MARAIVNGIEVYYTIKGEGKPVVFIHGLGSSTRDWESQLDFFSQFYKVIVFDLRGHGRSAKPSGSYSIKQFAEDTAALINFLKLGSVDIVGISLGGMVALQLAVDFPKLVRHLIIANCNVEYQLHSLKEYGEFYFRVFVIWVLGMKGLAKVLGKRLFPEEGQVILRETFIKRWGENSVRAYLASFYAIVGWSVKRHLASMKMPILVIASEWDYLSVDVKEQYVKEMPNAELVVVYGSRHAVSVDNPDEFNGIIKQFLEDRTNGKGVKIEV
jgi:pimeloyl-ACP methyl ester carboxylesterase